MQIRPGKAALAAIVVACAAVAAYWYWSPFLALSAMQSAASARDAEAFNAHVDYPRVRDSLKAQLASRMAGQFDKPADPHNRLAALGAMLGQAVSDKLVDALVRPETIMRAMQSGQFDPVPKAQDGAPAATPAPADNGPAKQKWVITRNGTDMLVATPDGAGAPGKQLGIVFERSGFAQWKLTDVRMPAP
jgi:hypothetical protein